MKKKTVHKKKKVPSKKETSYLQYVVITFAIVALVLIGRAGYQTLSSTGVLGTSINQDAGDQEAGDQNQASNLPGSAGELRNAGNALRPTPPADALNSEINNAIQNTNNERNTVMERTQTEAGGVPPEAIRNRTQLELNSSESAQVREQTLNKINEALQEADLHIGTTSANEFEITNKNTRAITNFPLSVDTATNMLSVTTPNGTKDVAVLPDQAVQNLIAHNVIDQVSQTTPSTTGAQLALVQLRLYGNNPVFQVTGTDNKNLFGFIPITINRTALVSAQTGQVVTVNESILSKIFDLFSVQP